MLQLLPTESVSPPKVSKKEILIDGNPTTLACAEINGQTYTIESKFIKIARLEDESYEDMVDPAAAIDGLIKCKPKPDIFTFLQRLPNVEPRYNYHTEWDSIAVLPISTFDHWWTKQIKDKTRNMVRKGKKAGVDIREASYDDDFVQGMTEIFNETPIRQGRRFWHYGKDFDTVKKQFSQFIFREELFGAYLENELVGFAMLANAGRYAILGQIISKLEHRDKAINNGLIATCIERCASKHLPYLVYANWDENSLSDFKRHCGFERVKLPRYFIPLTLKGSIALKVGLHRDWRNSLPRNLRETLKRLRALCWKYLGNGG